MRGENLPNFHLDPFKKIKPDNLSYHFTTIRMSLSWGSSALWEKKAWLLIESGAPVEGSQGGHIVEDRYYSRWRAEGPAVKGSWPREDLTSDARLAASSPHSGRREHVGNEGRRGFSGVNPQIHLGSRTTQRRAWSAACLALFLFSLRPEWKVLGPKTMPRREDDTESRCEPMWSMTGGRWAKNDLLFLFFWNRVDRRGFFFWPSVKAEFSKLRPAHARNNEWDQSQRGGERGSGRPGGGRRRGSEENPEHGGPFVGPSPRQAAPTEGKDRGQLAVDGRGMFPHCFFFFYDSFEVSTCEVQKLKQNVFSLNEGLSEWDVTASWAQGRLPCWTGAALCHVTHTWSL